MVGERCDRHASRVRWSGAAGAGGAEAQPALWHDGQGMCLLAKRLERGRFVWPRTEGEAVTITAAQLGYLLEGFDWRLPQRTDRPEAAG